MREALLEARNRWIAAAGGGVVIVAGLLLLFRLPAPVVPLSRPVEARIAKAEVQMARPDNTDLVLKAEAELRDLRPLFLPTERNAALPEPRLEPGRTFLDTESPGLTFTDADAQISRDLPPVATLDGQAVQKATPADVLGPQESRLGLRGFGRTEAVTKPFAPRGGYIEVVAMKDGGRVLAQPLPVEARPVSDKPWAPLELIAVVDAAGLVSPLAVIDGSRVDEVDSHFRTYLAREFRIGERLWPGFYRVIVAP
jgi:hypothetical protein